MEVTVYGIAAPVEVLTLKVRDTADKVCTFNAMGLASTTKRGVLDEPDVFKVTGIATEAKPGEEIVTVAA